MSEVGTVVATGFNAFSSYVFQLGLTGAQKYPFGALAIHGFASAANIGSNKIASDSDAAAITLGLTSYAFGALTYSLLAGGAAVGTVVLAPFIASIAVSTAISMGVPRQHKLDKLM